MSLEETELIVEEAWSGTPPEETLLVENERDVPRFTVEWRRSGTRVLAFLWRKRRTQAPDDRARWRPIDPQGILLLDPGPVPNAEGSSATNSPASTSRSCAPSSTSCAEGQLENVSARADDHRDATATYRSPASSTRPRSNAMRDARTSAADSSRTRSASWKRSATRA